MQRSELTLATANLETKKDASVVSFNNFAFQINEEDLNGVVRVIGLEPPTRRIYVETYCIIVHKIRGMGDIGGNW